MEYVKLKSKQEELFEVETKTAFRSVVAALNKFNRTVPGFVSIVLLASSVFIGANHVGSNAVSTANAPPIVDSSVLQGVEYVHVPSVGLSCEPQRYPENTVVPGSKTASSPSSSGKQLIVTVSPRCKMRAPVVSWTM